jgi:hypothetical protein
MHATTGIPSQNRPGPTVRESSEDISQTQPRESLCHASSLVGQVICCQYCCYCTVPDPVLVVAVVVASILLVPISAVAGTLRPCKPVLPCSSHILRTHHIITSRSSPPHVRRCRGKGMRWPGGGVAGAKMGSEGERSVVDLLRIDGDGDGDAGDNAD